MHSVPLFPGPVDDVLGRRVERDVVERRRDAGAIGAFSTAAEAKLQVGIAGRERVVVLGDGVAEVGTCRNDTDGQHRGDDEER